MEDSLIVPLEGYEDIIPIPQDDGPNPVVPIAYQRNYVVASDYLRALRAKDELSLRAMDITRLVLEFNPSHYTAWWFRRRIIFALGLDLNNELERTSEIAGENPKNYQVWYHRRALAEHRGNAGDEMVYVDRVLADDPKNYHAWSHRQWMLQQFRLLEDEEIRQRELGVVEMLLGKDLRNNSAWNHRWFILHSTLGSNTLGDKEVHNEISFALAYAREAPSNESPWNYIRGFFRVGQRSYLDFPEVKQHALQLKKTEAGRRSPHLLALLAEIYEREGTEESLNEAINALQRLRNEVDVVRIKFWEMRLRTVTQRLSDLVAAEA